MTITHDKETGDALVKFADDLAAHILTWLETADPEAYVEPAYVMGEDPSVIIDGTYDLDDLAKSIRSYLAGGEPTTPAPAEQSPE